MSSSSTADAGDDVDDIVRDDGRHERTRNRIALLQMPVTYDKAANICTAREYIARACEKGAELCVLPEVWNSPYATAAFPDYAESLPDVGDGIEDGAMMDVVDDGHDCHVDDDDGRSRRRRPWGESSIFLMEIARATGMYVIGGSVPEMVVGGDGGEAADDVPRYYNTCLIVNPSGKIVGKHRKLHLFDVSVPGGIHFMESDTLERGDLGVTYFDVLPSGGSCKEEDVVGGEEGEDHGGGDGLGRIGVGIWYVSDAAPSSSFARVCLHTYHCTFCNPLPYRCESPTTMIPSSSSVFFFISRRGCFVFHFSSYPSPPYRFLILPYKKIATIYDSRNMPSCSPRSMTAAS
jgi:hypothetical protein